MLCVYAVTYKTLMYQGSDHTQVEQEHELYARYFVREVEEVGSTLLILMEKQKQKT